METKKIMFTAAVIFALLITIGSAFAITGDDLEIINVEVNGVLVDELGESSDLKPLQQMTIKVTVKNNDTEKIAGITGNLTTFVDQSFDSNTLNYLNPGQTGELTFVGVVSLDEVEGAYPAEITVSGEDYSQNNLFHEDTFAFDMMVNQDPRDIIISDLALENNDLSCGGSTTLTVELSNIGKTDENDVQITVQIGSLSLGPSQILAIGNNEQAEYQFDIYEADLPNNGQNTITVTAHYFYDSEQRTKTTTITGEDCVVNIASASPAQSSVVVDKDAAQEFSVTMNNPTNVLLSAQWEVDGDDVQGETPEPETFAFELAANTYELGQHTVTVTISGSNPSLPIVKTWNVEIADNPADFTISEIVFTDVELGADDLTKQVTIKNIGSSEQLTNVQVAFVDVASKYGAAFTDGLSTLEQTLDAGEQASVTIQLDIPEDEDGGVIGKLKVTGTDANDTPVVKEANIVVHPKNYLKVSSVKVNGKTNGGLSLSESNEIKVEVRNDYTKDLDDVRVTVALLDADGDDLESVEKDLFENGDSLGNGDEETVTLDLDLQNEDLDENEYTLEITVEGSEGSNDYTTVETLTVQVDRGDEEVAITKAELSSSKLQCSAKTTLYVTIKNNSDKEFNNLKLRVRSNDLNLDLSKSNIDLEDYSGNDNEYETTFDLELTYADADIYTLTVEVLDDNDVVASKDVELEVKECLGESTASGNKEYYADEKLKNELQKSLEEYRRAQAQPVVKASFRESGEYTMLLGVLVILMAVASVLSMVVLLTRRR